jgi:hypothetical protein
MTVTVTMSKEEFQQYLTYDQYEKNIKSISINIKELISELKKVHNDSDECSSIIDKIAEEVDKI